LVEEFVQDDVLIIPAYSTAYPTGSGRADNYRSVSASKFGYVLRSNRIGYSNFSNTRNNNDM